MVLFCEFRKVLSSTDTSWIMIGDRLHPLQASQAVSRCLGQPSHFFAKVFWQPAHLTWKTGRSQRHLWSARKWASIIWTNLKHQPPLCFWLCLCFRISCFFILFETSIGELSQTIFQNKKKWKSFRSISILKWRLKFSKSRATARY